MKNPVLKRRGFKTPSFSIGCAVNKNADLYEHPSYNSLAKVVNPTLLKVSLMRLIVFLYAALRSSLQSYVARFVPI